MIDAGTFGRNPDFKIPTPNFDGLRDRIGRVFHGPTIETPPVEFSGPMEIVMPETPLMTESVLAVDALPVEMAADTQDFATPAEVDLVVPFASDIDSAASLTVADTLVADAARSQQVEDSTPPLDPSLTGKALTTHSRLALNAIDKVQITGHKHITDEGKKYADILAARVMRDLEAVQGVGNVSTGDFSKALTRMYGHIKTEQLADLKKGTPEFIQAKQYLTKTRRMFDSARGAVECGRLERRAMDTNTVVPYAADPILNPVAEPNGLSQALSRARTGLARVADRVRDVELPTFPRLSRLEAGALGLSTFGALSLFGGDIQQGVSRYFSPATAEAASRPPIVRDVSVYDRAGDFTHVPYRIGELSAQVNRAKGIENASGAVTSETQTNPADFFPVGQKANMKIKYLDGRVEERGEVLFEARGNQEQLTAQYGAGKIAPKDFWGIVRMDMGDGTYADLIHSRGLQYGFLRGGPMDPLQQMVERKEPIVGAQIIYTLISDGPDKGTQIVNTIDQQMALDDVTGDFGAMAGNPAIEGRAFVDFCQKFLGGDASRGKTTHWTAATYDVQIVRPGEKDTLSVKSLNVNRQGMVIEGNGSWGSRLRAKLDRLGAQGSRKGFDASKKNGGVDPNDRLSLARFRALRRAA